MLPISSVADIKGCESNQTRLSLDKFILEIQEQNGAGKIKYSPGYIPSQ